MRRWSANGVVALLLALPMSVGAAGFQTVEQGTTDMGRAMVGSASIADSAATAWYNPGAMTKLDRPTATGGLMGIFGDMRFKDNGSTTVGGTGSGDILDSAAAPGGLFYSHPINEKFVAGASFTAPFVGILDYSDTWSGRYVIQEFDFAAYAFTGAAAYQVTDKLSLGAQVMAVYANMDYKVAVPLPLADGTVHVHDADDWEPSFGLGLLYEPWEHTRIGISYKYEVDLEDLDGDINLAGGVGGAATTGVEVGFTLPQLAAVDITHEYNDKLTLFAGGAWSDYSAFDLVSLDLSGPVAVEIPTEFRDTWGVGLAAAYKVRPDWTLQTGWLWARSPVKNEHRTPMLPFDRQIRYGLGVIHDLSETTKLGLSYTLIDMGSGKFDMTTNAGTVSGSFDTNRVQMVALSLTKSF